MRRISCPCIVAIVLLFTAWVLVGTALAQVPELPASDVEQPASFDELPTLVASRDEAAHDKVSAIAYFTHGRILQQRRDFAFALRSYERAVRYGNGQQGLKEVVAIAMERGRIDEAARYAVLAEKNTIDTILLRRLAVDATNRKDWRLAARLYESCFRPQDSSAGRTASQVLMRAEAGRLRFLAQDYPEAAQAFRQVRQALEKPADFDLNESLQKLIVGNRRDTYALMARCALEAKQFGDAAALYRESDVDAPDSSEATLNQARVAERQQADQVAQELLERVLAKGDLERPIVVELLRRVLSRTLPADKLDVALEEKLLPCHTAHPENEMLRRELARCRFHQEKFAEAEALLSDASVTKPSADLRLLLAAIQRKQHATQSWLKTVSTLAAADGLDTVDEEILGAAQDAGFAEAVIAQVRDDKGDLATDQSMKRIGSLVALAGKQYDDAAKLWEASLPDDKASRGASLVTYGLRLLQSDAFERSMQVFQRVLDEKLLEGDTAAVCFYLSGAASLANKHDIALHAARYGLFQRPDDVRFAAREAWVLHHAGRDAESRTTYEALLKRFEDSSDADVRSQLRDARLLLSAICLNLADVPAAVERLEEVLDEFPEDVSARNDLGYLWSDRGLHLERSLRMAQRAVAANPENKAYRDTLGWVYFKLGRYAEATAELERAAADDSPGAVVLDHLGDALAKSDRLPEARSVWQKAREAFRQDGDKEREAAVAKKIAESD